MSLSEKVSEELFEAKSHLRNALKSAASNEKIYVSKTIVDVLLSLENLDKMETFIDKIENGKLGDSNIFGSFF